MSIVSYLKPSLLSIFSIVPIVRPVYFRNSSLTMSYSEEKHRQLLVKINLCEMEVPVLAMDEHSQIQFQSNER